MNPLYRLSAVGVAYYGHNVLDDVSLNFGGSQLVAVVGPNGAGKSTLLNVMAGLRKEHAGLCLYRDMDVRRWPRRSFARWVSFVPQSLTLQFPFTAEQVVMQGRTPYGDGLFESPSDQKVVEDAMAITETTEFRSRDFRSLSGGERQRVVLASAIAQEPETLLLDEPTTFLDLKHQVTMYRLLRDLCRRGILVIAVTHDLNLAAAYSDRVVMLRKGRVAADAAPRDVLSKEMIHTVFGLESEVQMTAAGRPWILYGD